MTDRRAASDSSETEVISISRRELRRRAARTSRSSGQFRRWARGGVLTALAALTIAVPVLGFDGADHSAHAHVEEPAAPPVTPVTRSALEVLSAAAGPQDTNGSRLRADPVAATRAHTLQASRAGARGALEDADPAGANGIRAALVPDEPAVVMPLAAGDYRMTSSYGGRADPITGGASTHTGVDLAAPLNTPIYAVADGVVDYVGPGRDGRSSMLIILRHEIDGQTVYSWYNHMYTTGLYVEAGQQVQAGDVIAGVGNNGYSTGPHLHFEIHLDDDLTTTDPFAWLREQDATDVSQLR